MFSELHDYDIFPKVFLTGKDEAITIHPQDARSCQIAPGEAVVLQILEVEKSVEHRYAGSNGCREIEVTADDKGDLHFTLLCEREGMYYIDILAGEERKSRGRLRVYALAEDMAGLYPFRGDLHLHTCRSDGHNAPKTVVSDYRAHGYDFMVISDHHRYYPSLEAREFLKIGKDDESPLCDLLVATGEEVHLPLNPVHIVNFGGKFSVNALVTPSKNEEKNGQDKAWRSQDGECPDPMPQEDYEKMVRERAEKVPLELKSERLSFAASQWIFEMIRKAGGLGIFAHPYWHCPTMQLSQPFATYFYQNADYDAFEVLGGEGYYQHNGYQTVFYYEMKAKGFDPPIVGSTDSHNSTENNSLACLASTIVFTEKNTTESLIRAIKAKRSVAVDTISREYRLVGDFRLVKYASFLMENWYPLHDLACAAEGYYLDAYKNGDEGAEAVLRAMKGRIPAMLHKYFDV